MTSRCDVVLIRPNDKKAIYRGLEGSTTAVCPPYWLALMGGWLRDRGLTVRLIDAEAEDLTPEETARMVKKYDPRLAGILPLGSNLNASTWKMHGASVLASAIKSGYPHLPVFLWGQHVSALPERTLREEACDFVVAGEGFQTVLELAGALCAGRDDPGELPGLWRKRGSEISGNHDLSLIEDLDALPVDGWDLLPADRYRAYLHTSFEKPERRDRYGMIMTSLGCPYNCSYCSVSFFSGRESVRRKSPEKAVAEIDYWVNKRSAYYLGVLDECFTADREHALEFCRLLKERRYDLSIWLNARADQVDPELLAAMYEAGVRWVCYGFESGRQDIRRQVRKGQYEGRRVREVVEMTRAAGISSGANFMFGLPGDTMETMRETLALARELNCEYPNFYCTMAHPGSELYRIAERQGQRLPDTWLGYAQLSYETTPLPTENLSSEEILAFRDYAFQAFFKDNPGYFQMLEKKFGIAAVETVRQMLKGSIPRKILGD